MSGDGPVVVEIALVSLRVSTPTLSRALALLDDRERAAASARTPDVRRRYVVAHAAARVVIGRRLAIDPALVGITLEPLGRPRVDGIAFNLSHSGERCAIAVGAAGVDLGVDLERVRVRPHLDRLAQRVFRPPEYDAWRTLPPLARPEAFAQRWTEVEAVVKARGTGIAGARSADGGLAASRDLERGWSCVAFDAGPGYVGAVAAAAPISVSVHALRLDDVLTRRGGTAC